MDIPEVVRSNPGLCAACKGVRHLCGESPCPLLRMAADLYQTRRPQGDTVSGPSPPSVFVGEYGYPYISAGPLIPLSDGSGKTPAFYENPSQWLSLSFPELLEMRLGLVRTSKKALVISPHSDRDLALSQELSMSSQPVDAEVKHKGITRAHPHFSFYTPPVGPTVELERIVYAANPRVPRAVEKAVGDSSLKAASAVHELYRANVEEVHIQRLLSIGLLGVNRRLVPTRWSITAVDDTLSKKLLEVVRDLPVLNGYYTARFSALGNSFSVILIPEEWRYEFLESWIPYTGGEDTQDTVVPSDWEDFDGRTSYAANTTGAYYAARLAVARRMVDLRRQGAAVVFMEVDRGWIAPLGVWRVREGVRAALKTLVEHPTLEEALDTALSGFHTNRAAWIRSSHTLTSKRKFIPLDRFIRRAAAANPKHL